MNFLIINGSPHKGNTWKLVEEVKLSLQTLDKQVIIDEIHLMQTNLPFCCGCSNCFRLGYEKCPHYEKVSTIVKAIERADGIIFASTTYNMRETALLKNLFDHLCFMLHRPHFFSSKALVITTTGGVGGKAAAKSIVSTLTGIGFNKCMLFTKASFSWNDYLPTEKTKKDLVKITNQFYKEVKSKKLHSPSSLDLIPYNIFRGMSLAYVKGTKYATKDGEYWTEACREKGVYDSSISVPFYRKPVGYLFYAIGKFAGKQKNMLVSYKKEDTNE